MVAPRISLERLGGAVAEWSKALLLRKKINENQKIPGSPPGLGKALKKVAIKLETALPFTKYRTEELD